jgi:hypothetical protein
MVKTTRAQRRALARVYGRAVDDYNQGERDAAYMGDRAFHPMPPSLFGYRRFRATVRPGPGCIMVPYAGMWLGIEPDGHTHG